MNGNIIDYGKLVDEAMHIIVYKVLKIVEMDGLPGDHHFFISFITSYPGVLLSKQLLERYPREMTIVLQYQYQDLQVDSSGFSATLSFSGQKEQIYVPYASITTFADPSVQFGLQFRDVEHSYNELDIEHHSRHGVAEKQYNDAKAKLQNKTNGKPLKGEEANNVIMFDRFKKTKKNCK